jgi:outer membrane protein assembly factor BamB
LKIALKESVMSRHTLSLRFPRLIAAVLVFAALAACDKDKEIDPPAELVDFKESLSVERLWSTSLGGGDEVMRGGLSPAASDEQVFAAGRGGEVVALQLATGKVSWRIKTGSTLSGGPGVGGGLVVVGSADGEVIALDAVTGTRRWSAKVGGEVLAAPAVGADAVIVRTVAGRLLGLSLEDGRELWREDQQIPRLTLRGTAAPVVSGSVAFCGFDNGRVISIETARGEVLWDQLVSPARGRTELERLVDIDSAVKILGADVFVASFQGRVAMLAADTGQIWWSREISSHRGLAADEDRVVVSGAMGEVVALRRRTGVDLWRQDGLRMRRLSAPALVGNRVAVADFEGYVHWLDGDTGAFVARTKIGGRTSNSPVVVADVVIFQDDEGRVTALRPKA